MIQPSLQKYINIKSPLLITGETGSGKSYLARKIFDQAKIHREKFLTVHLASLKEDLLESELFGYKKGAFTGAMENKNGYLKDVGSGTLFLDEIGELSLDAQKKLLYLMEEKTFTPIGASYPIPFLGRIIMATNRKLESMVKEGTFREDLYYRIKVFHLNLPSLHENPKILADSIDEQLEKLKTIHQSPYASLSVKAKQYLMQQEWKGNFRELKNALEYALVMSERNVIEVSDFPAVTVLTNPVKETREEHFISNFPEDFTESLELFEKMYLRAMFEKHAGKVNETARRLGISKTTLIVKARKYQINTLKIRADASQKAA